MTDILQGHKAGITFFDIDDTGNTLSPTQEIVRSYATGRTTIPEFVTRTRVMAIVPDSSAKRIADELLNSFGEGSEPYNVLFVKDVSNAYQLGTRLSGDDVLSSK